MIRLTPLFRRQELILLTGILAVYESQAEASEKIPDQWRSFLALPLPEVQDATPVYGASPCTGDRRIHYLCGVRAGVGQNTAGLEQLVLPAGEYAIFTVHEIAVLRDTWGWVLDDWLPGSGYRERSAPEFERFARMRGAQQLDGPVEIGIPIEST